MKISVNLYLTAFVLLMFSGLSIVSAGKTTVPHFKTVNLNAKEAAKLGIKVKKNKLSYIERIKIKADDNNAVAGNPVKVRKISVRKGFVNVMNSKKTDGKKFAPRFVVSNFEGGSSTYFRDLKDYRILKNSDNNLETSKTNTYAEANELVCVIIQLKKNKVALWYEPTAEFIKELPDRYRNEFKDENTNNAYTDSHRETSGAVIDLKVSPNPVTGTNAEISFKITEKRNLKISIHDISGRLIMTLAENDFHYKGEYNIDANLSDLPGGMYLIAITTDKGEQAVSRVIVAR
ncbi:MAG: T9SS type A sorting domain-containing protein [Candidatus Kapabacteria bacterium]|jgi:hypothetical protein|nr:T9SS type A sorting domain-containing protein [Candidatus Kapabacteria bacterium]